MNHNLYLLCNTNKLCLAAVVRGWLARCRLQKQHAAAIVLQRCYRRHRLQRSTHKATDSVEETTDENHLEQSAAASNGAATDTTRIGIDMEINQDCVITGDAGDSVRRTGDVMDTPHLPPLVPMPPSAAGFRTVSAAVRAAFTVQSRFHLAGAFPGIPYLEAAGGVLTRRRISRVSHNFIF